MDHQPGQPSRCVRGRPRGRCDGVYSTWNLLCGVLGGGLEGKIKPSRITLRPEKTGSVWPAVENGADGSQEILLGKPIVRITHQDIVDENRTKKIADVIASWIALDRINIVNRQAGIHFVVGPKTYHTGEPLGPERGVAFYWHPDNLPQCTANLDLSAVGLWRVLHHDQISMRTDVNAPLWSAGLKALREMLRWCCEVNPTLRGFVPEIEESLEAPTRAQ
jgi:hypothetical protein